MAYVLPAIIVIFGFVVPIILLYWLQQSRAPSWIHFATLVVLVGAGLAALYWSIPWTFVGVVWPWLYFFAFAVILLLRIILRRLPSALAPGRALGWVSVVVNIVLIVFWSFTFMGVVRAMTLPPSPAPLALSSPFREGSYYVISGGADFSTNQHYLSRIGRYALDITQLNGLGFSSPIPFGSDLESYAVYGDDVVAPCAGEVIDIESALPDQPPLHPDSSTQGSGGNHVVLFCDGHSLLIGHLRPGSVAVAVGDQVVAGALLGQVGNSGNTMTPHLHIGAVRGFYLYDRSDDEALQDLEPTPLLFQGKFLIRGDTLTSQ